MTLICRQWGSTGVIFGWLSRQQGSAGVTEASVLQTFINEMPKNERTQVMSTLQINTCGGPRSADLGLQGSGYGAVSLQCGWSGSDWSLGCGMLQGGRAPKPGL